MIYRCTIFGATIYILSSFPDKTCYKILLPEYLIHHHPQVVNLIVVNMNEDDAIIKQKVFGKEQTGIHHAEPVAVEVAAVFAVLSEQTFLHQVAFFVLV